MRMNRRSIAYLKSEILRSECEAAVVTIGEDGELCVEYPTHGEEYWFRNPEKDAEEERAAAERAAIPRGPAPPRVHGAKIGYDYLVGHEETYEK